MSNMQSISAAEMAARKFGKLRLKYPVDISPGSGKRLTWVCDCGKEKNILVHSVLRDGTSSCGRCNELDAEAMSVQFGELRIKVPAPYNPGSHTKVEWSCSCGRTTYAQVRYVVGGVIKSCGKCNIVLKDTIAVTKYGRLRMKNPESVMSGSNKKVTWVCDCGEECDIVAFFVLSGRTKSCGNCGAAIRRAYEAGKEAVRALRTPIEPGQLPEWCPRPLEVITAVSRPFRAECRICGSEYAPRWSGIRLGSSLTCGCSSYRVSAGQAQVYGFLSKHVECKLEHKIGKLKYDVFVPSANLAIEYNGVRWHSSPGSRLRDMKKYKNAVGHGVEIVSIFEDEWVKGRVKVEKLLMNRLGLLNPRSVRPSACEIRTVPSSEADAFYEVNHYLGKCLAPSNYGVFLDGRMIACASFKSPTRQSDHSHELVRMASDHNFRVHGVWGKIITAFICDASPSSIVSFSDNRLFGGRTYEKLGFIHDGDVRQDYYWVKGSSRKHKSTLRKTNDEKSSGKTEIELRTMQGYRRVWDLGKKRWVLSVKSNPKTP